jgi:hypothetical protein
LILDRYTVVGIETCYGMDVPRFEPRWGREFTHPSFPAPRPTEPPIQYVPGSFCGGKAAGSHDNFQTRYTKQQWNVSKCMDKKDRHDETYQVTQTLSSSHTVVCAKDEKRFGASVIFEPSKTQQNNKGQAVKTRYNRCKANCVSRKFLTLAIRTDIMQVVL